MAVTFHHEQWDRALEQLGPKYSLKAAKRAMTRTGSNAKTAMVRVLSGDMGLASKVVRDRIFVSKATGAPLKVTLSADTRKIPLIDFKARQSKRNGVTAKLPSPGAGNYPNAFIATMKSGHRGVFARNTVTRSRKGLRRSSPALGIHELKGPSIAHAFGNHIAVAEARASEMLSTNMDHEIKFLLEQAKQAGGPR